MIDMCMYGLGSPLNKMKWKQNIENIPSNVKNETRNKTKWNKKNDDKCNGHTVPLSYESALLMMHFQKFLLASSISSAQWLIFVVVVVFTFLQMKWW